MNYNFVNHRVEWVTSEGVSTNTVESMNNQLKVELKCRANRLGIEDDDREEKMKFLTECVNGKLKVNGGSRFRRILADIRLFCESVVMQKERMGQKRSRK